MLDADMFDNLSKIGSALRNNPRPFGGMQVRICVFWYSPNVLTSFTSDHCNRRFLPITPSEKERFAKVCLRSGVLGRNNEAYFQPYEGVQAT